MERRQLWLATFFYRDGVRTATFSTPEEAARWWCVPEACLVQLSSGILPWGIRVCSGLLSMSRR